MGMESLTYVVLLYLIGGGNAELCIACDRDVAH